MGCHFGHKKPTSIYFGGGTPSVLKPHQIVWLIDELAKAGFHLDQVQEVTIEVDPKTMEGDLSILKSHGVNRMSLGVQTCNNDFLSQIGRIHRFVDIQKTIEAVCKEGFVFSMDLLFGLPRQSLKDLQEDINTFLSFSPSHISTYLLEVNPGNKLYAHRPSEAEQVEMLECVEDSLTMGHFSRYELSNYAKVGFESKHNLLYWNDHAYLGLGLSSHSYLKAPDVPSKWGVRFWNPRRMSEYKTWVEDLNLEKSFYKAKPEKDREELFMHQSLTDFCHTQLRKIKGLSYQSLVNKYGPQVGDIVLNRCKVLKERGLMHFKCSPHAMPMRQDIQQSDALKPFYDDDDYERDQKLQMALTRKGRLLSNLVFKHLTFFGPMII